MKLTSPAFTHQGMIPSVYTCEGQDISPPLEWSGTPTDTRSFALIMDDPDAPAGIWVHWIIFNIPSEEKSLQERFPLIRELLNGTRQGKNSWGKIGYGGPCPPRGIHRYIFRLLAMDRPLQEKSGITKEELLTVLDSHILAEDTLIGRYQRANRM